MRKHRLCFIYSGGFRASKLGNMGTLTIHEQAEAIFDERWYRSQLEDDLPGDVDLFAHYLETQAADALSPHPLFDTAYYAAQAGQALGSTNPLLHYLEIGAAMHFAPHPLFNGRWYLTMHKDVHAAGQNPLVHYLRYGASEGRNPSEQFDHHWYLSQYPDVAEANQNPVVHYFLYGRREGRFKNSQEKLAHQVSSEKAGSLAFALDSPSWDNQQLADSQSSAFELDLTDETRLVSWDVWDTLLYRTCHPDEIKMASARYLLLRRPADIKPGYRHLGALYQARRRAENKLAHTADYEFEFAQACLAWLAEVLTPSMSDVMLCDLRNEVLRHELRAERRATRRDDAVWQAIAAADVPMVFASDFYMPESFLQELLHGNGADSFFIKGYASSEERANKRTGALFEQVLSEFELEPEMLLHVGDNLEADVNAAERLGIRTQHYDRPGAVTTRELQNQALQGKLLGKPDAYEAPLLQILGTPHAAPSGLGQKESELWNYGRRFAPVAVGFALSILQDAVQHGADTIYLFTREGVFVKKLLDRLIALDPFYLESYPVTQLLEVSRVATFAPSLEVINRTSLMRMWTMYARQSPAGLCASLNLTEAQTRPLFEEAGFDYAVEVHAPWKNEDFVAVVEGDAFQGIVEESVGEQRRLLKSYLAERGLHDQTQSAYVVDLGWRGTIQDNLSALLGVPLRGTYLGLFEFLNEQFPGSRKGGWLFDLNAEADWHVGYEIAPLEMLFNGAGGSVSHYSQEHEHVVAVTSVEPDEERVFEEYVAHFQAGVLDALPPLAEFIAVRGLLAQDLRDVARKIVAAALRYPPPLIADAFFALKHNETFGTGAYDQMGSGVQQFLDARADLAGSRLHAAASALLEEARWPEGFLRQKRISELIGKHDADVELHLPCQYLQQQEAGDSPEPTVGIFTPAPLIGSGGHRTIFNVARRLVEAGFRVNCILEDEGEGLDVAYDYLRGSGATVELGWHLPREMDYALATIAHSAPVVEQLNVPHKGYLVQDFEALFNPVGDNYSSAETSYTRGLTHLTVGSWLSHIMERQYGTSGIAAGLGIDHSVYRLTDDEREDAVCFLYQPEKPRRSPKLGIDALRMVKLARPETKIYVYGSDRDLDIDFDVENIGLIRHLDELNALYNRCRVGLCISMSNPSRIPFELMAAGTVPVDVYRYNNLFDYDNGTAILAYQSPASIATAILEVLNSDEVYEKHRENCLDFVASRSLDWECDVFVNAIRAQVRGWAVARPLTPPMYTMQPLIDAADDNVHVRAFCDWQKKLALGLS